MFPWKTPVEDLRFYDERRSGVQTAGGARMWLGYWAADTTGFLQLVFSGGFEGLDFDPLENAVRRP